MHNPLLRCGLALAGANTWLQEGHLSPEAQDAILNGVDASALDLLATDLVVLSACDTGKVPEQQTQELMVDFYGRVLAGGPRAEALRLAQLAMKEKYPDPFYWGALICQGDPGPLLLPGGMSGRDMAQ